jgi:predicted nucleotidyltransferase component of viral defense system
MSRTDALPRNVTITSWVAEAKADPVRHSQRQVMEILLHAIGMTPKLRDVLVLKGGILMSLAHGSYRHTGDIDFTAVSDPGPYADILRGMLDRALTSSAAELGYVDLVCAVQRFERQPRPDKFDDANAPALSISIGYAQRGSSGEVRLREGRSPQTIQVDISFREKILSPTELHIEDSEVTFRAYDIEDVIGEKLRALLQQVTRDRYRRQDVFDIKWLIDRYQPDDATKACILEALLLKSEDRDIEPTRDSLDDPEVRRRAQAQWESMRLELGHDLPDFDPTFDAVLTFYRSLPWPLLTS